MHVSHIFSQHVYRSGSSITWIYLVFYFFFFLGGRGICFCIVCMTCMSQFYPVATEERRTSIGGGTPKSPGFKPNLPIRPEILSPKVYLFTKNLLAFTPFFDLYPELSIHSHTLISKQARSSVVYMISICDHMVNNIVRYPTGKFQEYHLVSHLYIFILPYVFSSKLSPLSSRKVFGYRNHLLRITCIYIQIVCNEILLLIYRKRTF